MLFNLNRSKPASKQEGDSLQLPLLPLREVVVFPFMVVPLYVGRQKSIKALEHAMNQEKNIFLSAQTDAKIDEPGEEDIHKIGTIGTVLQLLKLPDGTVKALIEGKSRGRILEFVPNPDFFYVETELLKEVEEITVETEALVRSINTTFESYAKINKKIPVEVLQTVSTITNPSQLADTIVGHIELKQADKQELLETVNPTKRLEKLYTVMRQELEVMEIEQRIKGRIKGQMEKTQKEYYLNEQMRAIQKEMGEKDIANEIQELEETLKRKRLSREARTKMTHEVGKLKMMSPQSAEATVVRNYIDWVLSLPWYEKTRDISDVTEAERILEEDHYGLKKPKERILEYLAVQKLVKKIKGPILCLVGPPGVGKTSLAKSVARATGRKFVRLSLGGVRDEAEIRGHRRTYIGALPGKIIQSLRKAKSNNPVFCLDEVDKMSMDFRGDPSAALLEVLDPEQNHTFNDHYLDLDYDLSEVLFITTGNNLYSIPRPLQDRMEIIRLPGYTEDEKLNIAKKFLVKKQLKFNGLKEKNLHFSDQAILQIIRCYTREAGVRNLEREIASICRKAAREVVKNPDRKTLNKVTAKNVSKYLGVIKFKYNIAEEQDEIGLSTGLAVTEVGGDILMTEVVVVPGRGQLTLTGQLGDVMKESAQAAMSYVRSRAAELGLEEKFYRKNDFHIHIPEGAIPKDGPSAGIALTTSIVSALVKKPVRRDLAMTGEITLRGRVLPIGGLKEKIMAAHRGKIKTVIIPKENERDLPEIPSRVLKAIEIISVENVDEALEKAIILGEGESLFIKPDPAFMPTQTKTGPEIQAH